MKRFAAVVVLLSVSSSSLVFADPPPPPEPTPIMDAKKLGPQTEQVDENAYAKVVRVEAGGSIQDALKGITDASESKRYAIFVPAGEYKGGTIEMKPFVDLFGGFDAKASKRDIEANRTILDGEGQRRVLVGANNARLDGFVIRNGKVRGDGAGILCDHVSPTIANNTFLNNATLEPQGRDPKMIHQRGHDGAAIACMNGASPTIANNVMAGNTTEIGGGAGVAVWNYSMPQITNNVITGNTTGLTDKHLSRSSNGAAISASKAEHRPPLRMRVINNVITHNTANGKSDAGGVYLEYDSSPVVGANWLLGNWCEDDGSAIYVMKNSHPLFTHNIVAGNNSSAIRLSKEGRGELAHNIVFGNSMAVICISSWMNFHHNTIVDNANGVTYGNTYAPHLKPSVITENILYNNGGTGGLGADQSSLDAPIVKKNDIQGGYRGGGEGNFDEKPQFVADGGSGKITSIEYDADRAVTTITTPAVAERGDLAGRVISVGGEKWGVIKSGGADGKLLVWGDVRSKRQASDFVIHPTYRLQTPVAGDVGSHATANAKN
jgi:hypothetical protein